MNKKKIFLIIGFMALIGILSLSANFAANPKSETFYLTSQKYEEYKELNISETKFVSDNGMNYYNVNIKKNKLKNYRIKSLVVKYSLSSISSDDLKIINKTYNGYKKSKLTIKLPENFSVIYKLTINYYSNTKIKSEDIDSKNGYSKDLQRYNGKTAIIRNLKKIDISSNKVNYNIIQIKTKSVKYKIKAIKTVFKDFESFYHSFKGNGKTKILLKVPVKYQSKFLTALRVYYY